MREERYRTGLLQALGMIKWEQIGLEGNSEFGVKLQPIDFAAVARACGAAGYTITAPDEAESVLREALAHPGPAIIEAIVDPTEPLSQVTSRPSKRGTLPRPWHGARRTGGISSKRWPRILFEK